MVGLELPPLSLYVHIPWCVSKCPYCDFNSHGLVDQAVRHTGATGGNHAAEVIASSGSLEGHEPGFPETEYVEALVRDLSGDLAYVQGRKLHSIFFGGGTPSLFAPGSIGAILEAAEQFIGFGDDIEITLEANPGTVDSAHFRGYREVGINRLSVGIQSFNDAQLTRLGRIHTGEQARRAVLLAREAGFDNVNLDLMHGLPGQTLAEAETDLARALALQPAHLSWYQLTIEPNTTFFHRPPLLPRDQVLLDIQNYGHALLGEEGFEQYEISAYASGGRESRHNTNYWQFGDYLGIGAGAHGKITLLESSTIVRTRKTRRPEGYLARQGSYLADTQRVEAEDVILEFMMNALRLNRGVPKHYFAERTGLDLAAISATWRELEARGLVEGLKDSLRATAKGHYFLDTILAKF